MRQDLWTKDYGDMIDKIKIEGVDYVVYDKGGAGATTTEGGTEPTVTTTETADDETPEKPDNITLGQGVQDAKRGYQHLIRTRQNWTGRDTAPGMEDFLNKFYPDGGIHLWGDSTAQRFFDSIRKGHPHDDVPEKPDPGGPWTDVAEVAETDEPASGSVEDDRGGTGEEEASEEKEQDS